MSDLKAETSRFMQKTSLKCVPRIINAESHFFRFLWSVGFLGFFLMCSYQAFLLINEYTEFPKVMILHEDIGDTLHEYKFIRPQISVCNLNPLTSNTTRYTEFNIWTYEQYMEYFTNFTTCTLNCSQDETSQMDQLRDELSTLVGYAQNIGLESAQRISHSKEDFIIDCSAIYAQGPVQFHKSCSEVFEFHQQWENHYFNCYTLSYRTDLDPHLMVTGVTLVLYLDNAQPTSLGSGSDSFTNWPAEGAIISADPGYLLPVMATRGITLSPGMQTEVKVRPVERTRLGAPHGRCGTGNQGGQLPHGGHREPEKRHTIYTREICGSLCISQRVFEQCNCTDAYLPYVYGDLFPADESRNNSNNPSQNLFCGRISDTNDTWVSVLDRTQCAHRVRKSAAEACYDMCPLPCTEKIYIPQISSARWPQQHRVLDLYNYAADRGKVTKNHTLHSIKNFVNSNFLKVSLFLQELHHVEMEDVPKTTFSTFLSQLGGALNLWSGITVVVFVEVLELILRLLGIRKDEKQVKVGHAEPTKEIPDKADSVQMLSHLPKGQNVTHSREQQSMQF